MYDVTVIASQYDKYGKFAFAFASQKIKCTQSVCQVYGWIALDEQSMNISFARMTSQRLAYNLIYTKNCSALYKANNKI